MRAPRARMPTGRPVGLRVPILYLGHPYLSQPRSGRVKCRERFEVATRTKTPRRSTGRRRHARQLPTGESGDFVCWGVVKAERIMNQLPADPHEGRLNPGEDLPYGAASSPPATGGRRGQSGSASAVRGAPSRALGLGRRLDSRLRTCFLGSSTRRCHCFPTTTTYPAWLTVAVLLLLVLMFIVGTWIVTWNTHAHVLIPLPLLMPPLVVPLGTRSPVDHRASIIAALILIQLLASEFGRRLSGSARVWASRPSSSSFSWSGGTRRSNGTRPTVGSRLRIWTKSWPT